jgi:molybdopterin-guanine dinucleotide biosynthesis protein B
MKVVGFAGYSGAGKTTLLERLIPALKRLGQRVSVVKHAHHKFDIDHPGKDTYRHREAGAFEVVVASDQRLAVMREFEVPVEPDVHQLLAEVHPAAHWVLVEGFRHSDVPKIEIWRQNEGGEPLRPVLYTDDPFVVAIATDDPASLPSPTERPLFDLNDAEAIARWLIDSGERFEYNPEHHG